MINLFSFSFFSDIYANMSLNCRYNLIGFSILLYLLVSLATEGSSDIPQDPYLSSESRNVNSQESIFFGEGPQVTPPYPPMNSEYLEQIEKQYNNNDLMLSEDNPSPWKIFKEDYFLRMCNIMNEKLNKIYSEKFRKIFKKRYFNNCVRELKSFKGIPFGYLHEVGFLI